MEILNKEFKARTFLAADMRTIIFGKDPNLGFGWVALDVEGVQGTTTITKVEYFSASNVNFIKVFEPLVHAIYDKKCKNVATASSNLNIIANYRPKIVQDTTLMLINKNFPASILSLQELDDKNIDQDTKKPISFEKYFYNQVLKFEKDGELVTGITLEEYNSKSNPHKQHRRKKNFIDSWALLPPEDHSRFRIDLDADEYQSILDRDEFKNLLDYVSYDIPGENTNNVLISGDAGSGKTKSSIALAKVLNKPIVLFTGTRTLDKDEMFASIIPNEVNGGWKKSRTDLGIGCEIGAVIVLEEWAVTSGELQIGLNNTVYGAKRFLQFQDQTYDVHPDTIFIITTNVGYKGTEAFNKSFKERFYRMYFPRLDKKTLGKYLSKKFCKEYPTLSEDVVLDFVGFLYDLMDYMNDNFKNLDQFDTETPAICTRDIPRIMYTTINKDSVSSALVELLRGILVGVEDFDTVLTGVISKFSKEINDLESKLFMDLNLVADAKKQLKDFYGCFVTSLTSNPSANNASTIFDSMEDTDMVINSLKSGVFNV